MVSMADDVKKLLGLLSKMYIPYLIEMQLSLKLWPG